jgi:sporulation protein YlmC with PRC-barrel domain
MANTTSPRAEILRVKDFIGWAVTSANGANLGTVSDILIGRDGKVRFLAVDPGFFKKPYLLPVEALEWGDGSLQSAWTDGEVKALPPYDSGVVLTADVLDELGRAYPRYYGSRLGEPTAAVEGASIVPLRDAKDFRLAKGAPNLRGWSVYGSDNEKVGTVTQMLVDPVAMKVRYIDVDLADDLFGLTDDRHVLIPLESVELRERSEDVWVQTATGREIAALPAYLGGPVDPVLEEETEHAFRTSYASGGGVVSIGPVKEEDPPTETPPIRQADDDFDPEPLPPPAHDGPPPIRDAEFATPPVSSTPEAYPGDEPPPPDDDYHRRDRDF